MKTINENTIRQMVSKALKKAINEESSNTNYKGFRLPMRGYNFWKNRIDQAISKGLLNRSNMGEYQLAIDEWVKEHENGNYVGGVNENFEGEYRTKGSLNKKTLEKQASNADKTSGAAPLGGMEDYNPDWDESAEDILSRFHEDDTYDDSSAGGEYQIDFDDPYFYMDGKRVSADAIGNFHNDFAIVKKDGKCNYVDSNGELLSKEMWFDACNDFEDGFGLVSKDRKRNFIKDDGQLLLDVWVDRAGDFLGGCAPVIINGERHEVDREGNIR